MRRLQDLGTPEVEIIRNSPGCEVIIGMVADDSMEVVENFCVTIFMAYTPHYRRSRKPTRRL